MTTTDLSQHGASQSRPNAPQPNTEQLDEILVELYLGKGTTKIFSPEVIAKQMTNQPLEEAKARLLAWNKATVIDKLQKIEEMTHNGRGTILWEVDTINKYVTEELAALESKEQA